MASVVLAGLLLSASTAATTAQDGLPARSDDIARAAEAIARRLSPARRVGQLFLVPFSGTETGADSPVGRLIGEVGVGGVLIAPERGNFANGPDAPTEVARLTNALQSQAALGQTPYVPLFVALEQSGDVYPGSRLWGGMTPLPSLMALGATWEPATAERVGQVIGRELSAVGVNLLLGPQLDVVRVPKPATSGDLGVRAFGGSPSWVAQFGRAYIAGVHRGGGGRVAQAAGSFPGIGGADRSQAEELPVVESTLGQLAAADLAPFVAASQAQDPDAVSDAFVTSHVRYRAVQQQPDRPLSLDSGGLRYLWAQSPDLSTWRASGGLLVSPGLGLPAVRRYVDPDLTSFNARRVIRETLAAGNDLLTMTNVSDSPDPAKEADDIDSAIEWLVGAYSDDDSVRELVDASLLRVLELKLRLYGTAKLDDVLVDAEAAAAATGISGEETALVARKALTSISPPGAATAGLARGSPQPDEHTLFVVDERVVRECDGCEAYAVLDAQQMLATVRRIYGPDGTGRLRHDEDVGAITFTDLKAWLQAKGYVAAQDTAVVVPWPGAEQLAAIERELRDADWLVFAMRDVRTAEAPGSDALKLFLKATPPETADSRLAAIAFAAPYYLDTTETAKLTAYYAVYGATAPFVAVAIRALFGDEPASGASPVSIPGAGYDLDLRLQPELDQSLALELVGGDPSQPLALGSTFRVRTSPVRDGNDHTVPDGTAVTFRLYDRGEDVFLPDVRSETVSGRALAGMRAERRGEIEIVAVLDNGLRSEPLVVSIAAARASIAPSLSLPPVTVPTLVRSRVPVDWGILLLSLGAMLVAGVLVYSVDAVTVRLPARVLRLFLLSLAWGLAGYLLVAAGGLRLSSLAGAARLWPTDWNVAYQAPVVSFALAMLPLVPTLARSVRRGPEESVAASDPSLSEASPHPPSA